MKPIRIFVLLPFVLLGSCATISKKADPLCKQLVEFERSISEDSERTHWVELHWVGSWLDLENGWSLSCKHSGDTVAKEICSKWVKTTSFEFSYRKPMNILECYGYEFPHPKRSFGNWKSSISLDSKSENWVVLDIDLEESEFESGAIRFSVEPLNSEESLPKLRPLSETPNSAKP